MACAMPSVNMLEAVRRQKNHESLIQGHHPVYPDAVFLNSLSRNEMVILEHEGNQYLCRFLTSGAITTQMWFRVHYVAVKSADTTGVISKRPGTLVFKKVTVDMLGRIRDAGD